MKPRSIAKPRAPARLTALSLATLSLTALLLAAVPAAAVPAAAVPAAAERTEPGGGGGGATRGLFWTGADLSSLPLHESRGVKYLDGGKAGDLLQIARSNGWKVVRARLWVDPEGKPESQVSSLATVSALGKRIRASGLKFLLDIHFSDTWADPGHQKKPAAWDALAFPDLVQKVRSYTREVISSLRRDGAMPDMVQVGNETRNGLLYGSGLDGAGPQPGGGLWEKAPGGWGRAAQLLSAGLGGVREGAAPGAPPLTMLHVPDGQDPGFVRWYFSTLGQRARDAQPPIPLDYDCVGLSYYPADPWDAKVGYDGWAMARLSESMSFVATALRKPVMVVETSWPQAGQARQVPGGPQFPLTPAGQAEFYRELIRTVRAVPGGLGIGVVAWDQDSLNWNSVFDSQGNSLPAVRALGQP